jgi:hypothetical protein
MFRLSADNLNDLFENLIFNAQCLYGCAMQRPLVASDFSSLSGDQNKSLSAIHLALTPDEQKEVLKTILKSKPIFDDIIIRLDEMEIALDTILINKQGLNAEQLNECVNRETHTAVNDVMKKFGECIENLSPSAFHKIFVIIMKNGIDVEKAVATLSAEYKRKIKEAEEFLKGFDKIFPPDNATDAAPDLFPEDEDDE